MQLSFQGRSFCFTGALADLKRTAAQREVRARGGLTVDRVNERLDYLVIGSKGSPGWKHGSYGRKIEEARDIARKDGRPRLIAEPDFMDALAQAPPTNSGAIDTKVVVVTYKFLTPDPPTFDQDALEKALRPLQQDGAHIRLSAFPLIAYQELFGASATGSGLAVEVRVVRQTALEFGTGPWLDRIERLFEAVSGLDGKTTWFERSEGSTDYVRLLAEVPQSLRVPED